MLNLSETTPMDRECFIFSIWELGLQSNRNSGTAL